MEKILKASREIIYQNKCVNNKINSWLLVTNSGGQKAVGQHIRNAERKNCQPQILYQAKLLVKNAGKIKTLQIKQKLIEVFTSRLSL